MRTIYVITLSSTESAYQVVRVKTNGDNQERHNHETQPPKAPDKALIILKK